MPTVMVTPGVNLALSLFKKKSFCHKIETQASAFTPGTVRFCIALFSIVFFLLHNLRPKREEGWFGQQKYIVVS